MEKGGESQETPDRISDKLNHLSRVARWRALPPRGDGCRLSATHGIQLRPVITSGRLIAARSPHPSKSLHLLLEERTYSIGFKSTEERGGMKIGGREEGKEEIRLIS